MVSYDGTDFNEAQVKAMLARNPNNKRLRTWFSCGKGSLLAIRMNWLTFLLGTIVTWGFAAISLADKNAGSYFGAGKSWVSQNFTWLYIRARPQAPPRG